MTEETSKSKVLLLDDDKFLLDMYAMKFSQQGFEVHACLSVKNALDLLRGGYAPDAVLFDIIMPEHDGFTFLQTLHDEKLVPNALRIALTNQNDEVEKNHAQDLGADLFLIKATLIPSEVVNMVKEQLAKRSRR